MAILTNLRKRVSGSDNERGAILILSALIMMLLLFIAAFATDLGAWYRQGQAQQRAADVGSLNGMQAYDREYKAYFDTAGVQTWTQLTAAQRIEAERQAMAAAVNTIIGLLETSGHTFSSTPTEVQLSPPPNVAGDQSIFTITSDNGTVVTITREADGMSVSLSADGDQYFSNLLRDAPQITRKSTAVLSNCGAECTHTIEINPPFVGFNATGKGDGYKPLLFDKDTTSDGIEEIWAVNHHSNGGTNYEIICMSVETKSECSGTTNSHYTLNYQTASRSVEYMAPNGKIYFAGRDIANNRGGIVCFDAATRAYCSTAFVDQFDSTNYKWPNTLNLVGPYEYNGNLYVVAQNGQLGCVTTAMVPCATPIINLASFGDSRLAALNDANKSYASNGEQIGSKLYITQTAPTGLMFSCIDLSNNSSCFTPVFTTTVSAGGKNPTTFFKYDTAGNETGICVYQMQQKASACVSLSGVFQGEVTGMSTAFASLKQNWGGDAFSWEGKRTFFGGGNSNRVGCWSWEDGGVACPDSSILVTDSTYVSNGNGVEPYAFTQVTDSCIVGLGDESIFFSFNPEGFTPCVDAKLSTVILPCTCADNTNKWGEVRLPSELMAKVDQMWATISATEGGAAVSTDLDRVELHNNGGIIDLRTVDPSVNVLYLTLEVNAKLDPTTGDPVWTEPISADLAIIVQPTLAN
ncbi:MAG: hypothetical protein R8J94_04355 [Acidimicrobiia bacterium]|nr:hypothetical protein [Acidimicrobiia bacterium]